MMKAHDVGLISSYVKGRWASMVYLDMTKAFIRAPYNHLTSKIPSFGIITFCFSQVVTIGEFLSSSKPITSGVVQGGVLGLLFSSKCDVFSVVRRLLPETSEEIGATTSQ